VDLNFKGHRSKQGAEYQEAAKKRKRRKANFRGSKAHFTAGNRTDRAEKQARIELQKGTPGPARRRQAEAGRPGGSGGQGIPGSSKEPVEKDPNAHLVWFQARRSLRNTAGRNEDAAQAYQQPSAASPTCRGITITWATYLARAGKIEDAKAAYTRARNSTHRTPQPHGATLGSACTTRIGLATPSNPLQ